MVVATQQQGRKQETSHHHSRIARETIGRRLREARRRQGLTIKEAAELAGLSRSFVNIVERGASEIAVTRLIRLAAVYDVAVTELLDHAPTPTAELVPADAGYVLSSDGDAITIRHLTAGGWELQPFVVELKPGASVRQHRHIGDEFVHCLSGSVTVIVDGESHRLSPGDTLAFGGHTEHAYVNDSDQPARFLGATRHRHRN